MTSAQVGKTEILNNIVGYHVDQDPAPMLILQPTLDMAQTWSKDRLAPMLRDTPRLQGRVKDPRARDSGNTLLHKQFPGGHITACGANSPSSLASRPIRVVLCDEVDRYPASAGAEGDPVSLAEKRSATFWNRRIGLFSTPTLAGISRIEKAYEASDQRKFWLPCSDCDHEQTLSWDNVRWDRGDDGEHLVESAVYVCEGCGSCWDDASRWRAVRGGRWIADAPFRGTAGFWLSALYSPWVLLRDMARKWLRAKEHPELLKTFVNTELGETWEEKYHSIDASGLRREPYPERDGRRLAPDGVAVMTAGVDLQDDRLEVAVDGWGFDEEWWRLEYHVLDGDPSSIALWDDLWRLLCRPRPMERGGEDYIRATGIDTGGHHTQMAYSFCRPRIRVPTPDGRLSYVFALKGQQGSGQVWPRDASRNNVAKIPLWNIRVDPAKELIYSRLQKVVEPGPAYIHIPDAPEFGEKWAQQLTAERVVERIDRKGFPVRVWELRSSGRRNEVLDTSVYSYAALCGLRAMGLDLQAEVEALEKRPAFHEPPAGAAAVAPAPTSQPQGRSDRQRDRWVEPRRDWLS